MSIVYDFPAIKAKLRGDDWWEPAPAAASVTWKPYDGYCVTNVPGMSGGYGWKEIALVCEVRRAPGKHPGW